jgi:hypothetical protein
MKLKKNMILRKWKKKQINLDEFSKPRLISQIPNPLNSKFVLKKIQFNVEAWNRKKYVNFKS